MEHRKTGFPKSARALAPLVFSLALFAAPALSGQAAASGGIPETNGAVFSRLDAEALRSGSAAFPSDAPSEAMDAYARFYGLSFPYAEHRWGFVDSIAGRIFVQGFEPARSVGTLLFIHGYMDHSGCQGPLVEDALARGWGIYLMDLPGHGLSDGPSCDIAGFEVYGGAARAFMEAVRGAAKETRRMVAAGHSTGCAAWIIGLSGGGNPSGESPFERAVFGAPLVRSAAWGWSKAGFFLGSAFIRDLPRGPHTGPELIPYPFDADPLAPERFPLHWVKELFLWDGINPSYGSMPCPLTVVQGDKDTVVDWKYNLAYLEAHTEELNVEMVEGGSHHVFRYAGDLRDPLERVLDECLGPRREPSAP